MTGALAGLALLLVAQGPVTTEADRMYADGRYQEAAAAYLALLDEAPEDPGVRLRLGASLMSLGRPEEALPHLEAAEGESPEDPAILQVLAQAYLATGRFADAADRFGRLLERTPDAPDILLRLGACQYQLGDFEAAAASFRHALRSQPGNPRALAGLGMSLNSLERPGEARAVLERAIEGAPSDRMARLALARSLTDLGEFLRADELLRALTAEGPGDWEAWFFLAELRFRNSYHQQALEALDRCLALRPDDPQTRVLRFRSLVKLGRLEEAGQALEGLSSNPDVAADPDFLLGHGEYSFHRGDLATALVEIDAALARRPRSGILHYWKARILLHSGETAAAQAEAERAVDVGPDLPEPRGLLVRIYRLEGKESEAAEQIEWLRNREAAVARGARR